ncbi:MAG: 3-deoxy-D-manno-octulosonic acid transferase [Deltaproteobacteria bacterium]|nr:MAG: 3-deoxy-D-manno-octulosonic acid transferase [Deltaproteobacteria bacterium]
MHWIYTIASYLFFALASPVLLLHPKTREGWARRLGVYPSDFLAHRPKGPGRPRIWLHGASAGDLSALSPMICEFKRRLPGCTVVVTTLTNSGALMARRLSGVDEVSYLPWDLPGATRRAVQAIDPDLLVLEYTELWPHLIRAARRQGARIVLTNGRFSENNLGRYRWLFAVSGRPLASFDLLLMREDEEAERVLGLGAPLDRVWVTGNTKFDALLLEAGNDRPDLAGILDLDAAPVLIAGSTHEGEDLLVIDVWERLLADHPDLQLVIAPRYLERCSKLRGLAEERGFAVRLRSAAGAGPRRDAAGRPAIVVLDSIGELVAAYRLGTLVFVGGSFTDRGGQNILEPAAQGKPVLFGPNMANFHDAVQVLVGRGGIQVNDAAHFYRVAHELLSRPEKIAELGELAQRTVHGIRGASRRNVDHMLRLLGALGEAEAA